MMLKMDKLGGRMGGAMLLESRLLLCLGVSQCSASEIRLLLCLGESVTVLSRRVCYCS